MARPSDILLVEDNPADVELTLEAFRISNKGNRLVVCRDGEEAIEYLFQCGRYRRLAGALRPDLVLLDLNLPRMSGVDVLALIRKNERLRALPVVVFTTSEREEDIASSFLHGANSYLTKPVKFDECVQLVGLIQHYWLELSKLPPR